MSENECTKFVNEKKEPVKKEEPKEEIPNQKICTKVQTQSPVKVQDNEDKNDNIKNKGTGAGGLNTNKNGVKLEERTRKIIDENMDKNVSSNKYNSGKRRWEVTDVTYQGNLYIRSPETAFTLWETKEGTPGISKAHGAKEPDDLIINTKTRTINWIECKVQNGSGSVAEKLQGCGDKIENLKRRFPGWNINYVYILSSYFRENAPWEISRLDEKNILYIFEDDESFGVKLMDYSFR